MTRSTGFLHLRWLVAAVAVGLLASVQVPASAASFADDSFVVSRVVDGDTVNGTWATTGEAVRVRFLNVNTPEMGSCLAQKAKEFTERALPAGATPALRFDRDRYDDYGRTLAVVTPEGESSLSVQLARHGLGVPLKVEPNGAHYPAVVRAARAAQRHKRGLFDPRVACSPARELQRARRTVAQAQSMPVRSRADYDAVLVKLAAARTVTNRLTPARFGLRTPWFRTWVRAERAQVRRQISSVRSAKAAAWTKVSSKPKPKPKPAPAPPKASPKPNPPGYWPPGVPSGYTGPRCYAPGGKTWRPC